MSHWEPKSQEPGKLSKGGEYRRNERNTGEMRGGRRVEPSSTPTGAWRKRTVKQEARTEESEADGQREGGGTTSLCPYAGCAASQGNTDPSL